MIPARGIPFLHTGYAGPVMLRTTKGRGHKTYEAFAIFVCINYRVVHLKIVSDYSSDRLVALRFILRRGLCHHRDCGTNFIGADCQLRAIFVASSAERRK